MIRFDANIPQEKYEACAKKVVMRPEYLLQVLSKSLNVEGGFYTFC